MNNANKVPLSVVIITKNEEKRIKDCLESVKWAGEIVVVDDFSSDKTVEIARGYTDKVYQKKMTNEGVHRNYAYSLSSYEWVLSLDADERVTPGLKEEIERILREGTECNGFTIPRRNFIGHYWLKYGGQYPSAQLRMFRKNEFRYEEVDVHPRAFMKDPRGQLKGDILHYTYRDVEDLIAKLNNHTDRESKKWLSLPKGMPFSRAFRRTIDRFLRTYYRKKGKNDGVYGLIFGAMSGFYQFLSYAKYWSAKLDLATGWDRGNPASPDKIPLSPARKKIGAFVLTKNEEDKIKNCLESLKWMDDVVIVDGFSTDRTVDIAHEYGVKVVQHRFEGDFGLERNIGIENLAADWILSLDADEVVTEGFKKRAVEILRTEVPYRAYKFLRKNYFLGRFMRYGGWYHYSHHFLMKGFARYEGRVHHQLIVNGDIGKLDADIEHYPFQSVAQLVSRQNRYTTIEAREMLELRGKIDLKEVLYNIKVKPLKLFWKFYVKKQGFREGMHGFVFSVLFAWVHFLRWAKYWEMAYGEKHT